MRSSGAMLELQVGYSSTAYLVFKDKVPAGDDKVRAKSKLSVLPLIDMC